MSNPATANLSGILGGRRVLVTGAASGIGAAVAAACERAGATVVRADLTAADGIVSCDVRSEGDVVSLFGGPAGGGRRRRALRRDRLDRCDRGVLARALAGDDRHESDREASSSDAEFARHCRGPGSLTFIASAGGLKGAAMCSAYGASKFGVVGLMRCMALELAPRRLRVNAVCPTACGRRW